ncbi:MAG: hypothetical protein H7A25_16105 [Leptospiraceae bacterium]|nr:hypothetical protein [Leptospiraceae bacterium]MCP5501426.1 hypothetical protein [Leptospiraceae bacterium]
MFTLDAGVNNYNNDYYLYLAPGFNLGDGEDWGLSFQIPLNLLIKDNEPYDPKAKFGKVRTVDYDERSDYQRLLNYLWFGNYGVYEPGKVTFSFYIGKMFDGKIGHGTIINRYVNNQRIENYKLGVMADVNTDYGGLQVFTNSVWKQEVNAGRAYIRPYGVLSGLYHAIRGNSSNVVMIMPGNVMDEAGRKRVIEEVENEDLKKTERKQTEPKKEEKKEPPKKRSAIPVRVGGFDPNSIWNRFAIGLTSAVDGRAPYTLDYDTTGHAKLDKYMNPGLKETRRAGVVGVDLEFALINTRSITLMPYADFNRMRRLDNAKGQHYGVIFKIGNKNVNLTIKPEYRRMTPTYLPMYFDSFYEVERYQYDLDREIPLTKYAYAEDQDGFAEKVKGYYHTLIFNYYKLGIEATYEDYDGKDNSRVFLGAYIPLGSYILLSGFYTKKGFNGTGEAFKVDDKSQGVGEVAVTLGPLILRVQNRRRWVLDEETNKYKAKDEKMVLFSGGKSF